ncbi:MAG: OpgC domain-containing protein, partial [Reyranellales bacterium]
LFAGFIALSWHYNSLERLIPAWLARQIYPIDKTNIDILRFVHFLAIAWLVRMAVRPDAAFLKWRILRPLRRCGEHSLQVFCLGTFLALSAQVIDAHFEDSVVSQFGVSLAGLFLMSAAAYVAGWFKRGPAREDAA